MTTKLQTEWMSSEGRQPPVGRLTYEEFLNWADDKTFAEWVDGDVTLMSPVSLSHNDIAFFLGRILAEFAESHGSGRVMTAPFQMRMRNVPRGREPDLMFVANAHLSQITKTYLDGPADLAVEVVSPESLVRDRGEKYAEYEIEGVKEYWILDPETNRADFFLLNEDGQYERAHPDAKGIYLSTVLPGFWLNVNWLWQQPLPLLQQIRTEWEQG